MPVFRVLPEVEGAVEDSAWSAGWSWEERLSAVWAGDWRDDAVPWGEEPLLSGCFPDVEELVPADGSSSFATGLPSLTTPQARRSDPSGSYTAGPSTVAIAMSVLPARVVHWREEQARGGARLTLLGKLCKLFALVVVADFFPRCPSHWTYSYSCSLKLGVTAETEMLR